MIPRPDVTAVFHYAYCPLTCKRSPQDGGFSVTLYHDDRFVITLYNEMNQPVQHDTFVLPAAAKMRCIKLIDEAEPWLTGISTRLRLPEDCNHPTRFISRFGFENYPYIGCEDIAQMVRGAFGSPEAHAARHLCALYEDIAQVFVSFGFDLDLDGYIIAPGVQQLQAKEQPVSWNTQTNIG